MLAGALQAEVEAYMAGLACKRDESGRRPVVRNGYNALFTAGCRYQDVTSNGPEIVLTSPDSPMNGLDEPPEARDEGSSMALAGGRA
jgi:hypothetical protein